MNLSLYKETELELWISEVYQEHGIYYLSDLALINCAKAFNCEIVIWDKPTRALWDDEFGTIFLNDQLKGHDRRDAFFHELGHPSLHVGNQLEMPREFSDYQEEQAQIFQMYASMPMYMIRQIELPRTEMRFIELLSWEFDVSPKLAMKRTNQIKRRIYQAHLDKQFQSELKFHMELFG